MANFHFDLVSPERLLFSGEVQQVDLPGSEGDFGVLADHAPLVATLRPGILVIQGGGQNQRVVVSGGFAEVSPQGVLTVLADSAVAVEDFDRSTLSSQIADVEQQAAAAEGHARDRLSHRAAQLKALQATLSGGGAAAAH